MKKYHVLLTTAVALSLAAHVASAKTRIALLDIASDDNSCRSLDAGGQMISAIQAQLPDIADVEYVERADMTKISQEVNLARSGLMAADTIRIGRMLNADIIMRGRFLTTEKSRVLNLEAVDLHRAEVLAESSIQCAGDSRDPVQPTPELLQDAMDAVRALISEALEKNSRLSSRRTIGGLFIRNISPNDRLDYLNHHILDKLARQTDKTEDLRWLRFVRTGDAYNETQLALLGLTSPDISAWRSPADLFVWGSILEQPHYSGPAEQLPFTITLEVWDGTQVIKTMTEAATMAQWESIIEKMSSQLHVIARQAQPKNQKGSRAAIAKEVVQRIQEINRSSGQGGGKGTGGKSLQRYCSELYDLALFLTPEDRTLEWSAISARRNLLAYGESEYSGRIRMLQNYFNVVEKYGLLNASGSFDQNAWMGFSECATRILSLETQHIITAGVPYDLTDEAKNKSQDLLMKKVQAALIKLMNVRQKNPGAPAFATPDYSTTRLIETVLESNIDVENKINFIETLWPWVGPYYLTKASSDSQQKLRTAMVAAYKSAGRSARFKELLASTGNAVTEMKTIRVSAPSRPVSPQNFPPLPANMPPELAKRIEEQRRLMQPQVFKPKPVQQETVADVKPFADMQLSHAPMNMHLDMMRELFFDGGTQYASRRAARNQTMLGSEGIKHRVLGAYRDILWVTTQRATESGTRLIVYQPAADLIVYDRFPGLHTTSAVGVVNWQQNLIFAYARDGLGIWDSVQGKMRLLAGPEGLATASLDAIVADGHAIILSGHDKTNKSRLIRFDPILEKFEDLLTDVPLNTSLWLRGNTLIYRAADGYAWLELDSRKQGSIVDSLAQAGVNMTDTATQQSIRMIGFNDQGLWLIAGGQLCCLSPDRASLVARLPLNGIKIQSYVLSEDGLYLFAAANAWALSDGALNKETSGSYLLVADLAQKQWILQCRIPGQPASLSCFGNRIWLESSVNEPLLSIPYTQLGLGSGVPLTDPSAVILANQLLQAMYNGDVNEVRKMLTDNRSLLTEIIPNASSVFELMFRHASLPVIRYVLEDFGQSSLTVPENAMIWAIRRNEPDLASLLIRHKALCNKEDVNSRATPIRIAAMLGRAEIIPLLLNAKADVNATDKFGESALSLAILFHQNDAVKALLAGRPKLDTRHGGWTPLHIAVMLGDKDMVQMLLANGANVAAKSEPISPDQKIMTPLMVAVRGGNREIVSLLMAKGAKPGDVMPDGGSALTIAMGRNDSDLISLLKNTGDSTAVRGTPKNLRAGLTEAINSRNLEQLKSLLDSGANPNMPNDGGVLPLYEAGDHGSIEQIMELLRRGANPEVLFTPNATDLRRKHTKDAFTRIAMAKARIAGVATTQLSTTTIVNIRMTLDEAIEEGNVKEAIAVLRENGEPYVAAENWPYLHRAVARRLTDLIKPLLEHKVDPDLIGPQGMTPLMIAAAGNDVASLRLLLQLGARSYLCNAAGMNSLDLARLHGHRDIIAILDAPNARKARPVLEAAMHFSTNTLDILHKNGIQINVSDVNGQTALMSAVRVSDYDSAQFLLERKVDPNQKDQMGRTALHWAVMPQFDYKQKEIIQLLISSGANADLPDSEGITPRQLAKKLLNTQGENLFRN